MIIEDIKQCFKTYYPDELINGIIDNYEKALKQYRLENWQYCGNEIGQFVEIARRMIEYDLTGNYTPLNKKLANFNQTELNKMENASSNIDETFRIIIPRRLHSMYCIRSKRGMIHKGKIDPNKMDASVLLQDAKWILAEFFRMCTSYSIDKSEEIISSIIYKDSPLIWDTGGTLRVLETKMPAKNQVLCLLYTKNSQSDVDLCEAIEYSNFAVFKSSVLKKLHISRLIEYKNGICKLSPLGIQEAEKLLK
ncbi:MAG: hypothetical protein IKF64_07685 [Eubacterium sp.]|nr:hypothetical protein [Eubacterium sp.]